MDLEADLAAVYVGLGQALDDPGRDQFPVDTDGPAHQLELGGPALMVLAQQPLGRLEGVAGPLEKVQEHRVAHAEGGGELLRHAADQALIGGLAPGHETLGRFLPDHLPEFLLVIPELRYGLRHCLGVLHDVLGRLDHYRPGGVVTRPPGPPGDLVEFARLQHPGTNAVVLAQRRQQHRADGHVDADPEGIGSADHLEEARLCKLFDEPPVLRQHPGVMHPDAVADKPVEGLAKAGGEAERRDELRDAVLLLPRTHVDAHEVLCTLDRLGLAEVHHVNRCLVGAQQFLEGLLDRRLHVVVVQGDGPLDGCDRRGGPPGTLREVLVEERDVAEGRRHEEELRLGQFEQRNLPGPAALRVGVEMKLVHHHRAQLRGGTLAQGEVGQDLRGAADDGGALVHSRVAGDHADVLRTEDVAEGKELLGHQRLDGSRVIAGAALGEGLEVRGDGDEGFSRPGGCRKDHIVTRDKLHGGFILRRVQLDPARGGPGGKSLIDGIRTESAACRRGEVLLNLHCPFSLPVRR